MPDTDVVEKGKAAIKALNHDVPLPTVTEEMRTLFYNSEKWFADDDTVLYWYNNQYQKSGLKATVEEATPHNTDGCKTTFYNIDGCKDVDDVAEHWELKGDEFNCLKAIAGIALGSRHSGTTPMRDANKLVHYANRIKARLGK